MPDKSRGWVKLWRSLAEDDELWLKEPFTRGQAWVDLIMLANHKPSYIRVRGNRLEVERGQVGWSIRSLAERWKWSRGKVSRFLSELESKFDQQIVTQKNAVSTITTITKYEEYQGERAAKRATDGPQTGHRRAITRMNKNDKNEKKGPHEIFRDGLPIFRDADPSIPHDLIESILAEYGPELTMTELRKAHRWLLADPKRRKKLYGRFIGNWFDGVNRDRAEKTCRCGNVFESTDVGAVLCQGCLDKELAEADAHLDERMEDVIKTIANRRSMR